MLVILKQRVETLGDIGDVLNVNDGYARNFLFPRGLAEVSTPQKAAEIKAMKEKEKAKQEKEAADAQMLAEKIKQTSCTITVQAGDEDKLFGAVTAADIAKALVGEGINIPKKKIVLEEPIKKLGIYSVTVKLAPSIESVFKLWIVKE
jgi:large subunit ribosomal protein L9